MFVIADATDDEREGRLFAHICAYIVEEVDDSPSTESADAADDLAGLDDLADLYARLRRGRAARTTKISAQQIKFSIDSPPRDHDEQLASTRWFIGRDPYLVLLDKAVGDIEAVLRMAGVKRCPGKPLSEADKDRLCDYARFSWPGRKGAVATRVSELPPSAEVSERDDLKRRLTTAFNAFTRNPTEANRDSLAKLTAEFCDTRPKRSGKGATLSGGAVDSNRRRH